jgi:hypothetical protein
MQVGGAFGVNLLAVLLQRRTIFHGEHLASELNESNAEFLYGHARQALAMEATGMPPLTAFTQAFGAIGQEVAAQAMVLAFRDCFFVIAIWFVIVLFTMMLMPKPRMQMGAAS